MLMFQSHVRWDNIFRINHRIRTIIHFQA